MLNKRRIIDTAERMVVTFIGAFIAIYITAYLKGDVDLAFLKDPGLFSKALSAGIAALIPLVSSVIGFKIGDKNTGSVVPSNKPEEVDPLPYRYIDHPEEG